MSARDIKIEKVTLNIGAGKSTDKLEKGFRLLKIISEGNPVKTITKKRIPTWGLRPGLPIGCKITLRKDKAKSVLKRLLEANDFEMDEGQFDENGNIAFGVKEYINIPGVNYNPEIEIMGLQCCVTLERAGFRIKKRKKARRKLPKKQRIGKDEAISFMKKEFGIKLKEK
jgi:large subunit ribosomal protein L5